MFHWNIDPVLYQIPFIDHPIRWYGLFFGIGFISGYFVLYSLLKQTVKDEIAHSDLIAYLDKLLIYLVIGTIVGARLGECLFYGWENYLENPWEILMFWKGGLSSHGGALGAVLSTWFFSQSSFSRRTLNIPVFSLLNLLAVPAPLVGFWIRLGNFFNHELVGKPTSMPWGVTFTYDAELSSIPRHPVQLYEAIAYLSIFLFLFFQRKRINQKWNIGGHLGWMICLTFLSRIILENFKAPFAHSESFLSTYLHLSTGQLLSIPYFLMGLIILKLKKRKKSVDQIS